MSNPASLLPEANFREKIRVGEVYRNLNGNEMFQKFYYRCLECSMDFESSPEFEEHVIVHYLQEDGIQTENTDSQSADEENVIDISSDDEDEEENAYLYAVEVQQLVEDNISETDLPLPLMQMLNEQAKESNGEGEPIELDESSEESEKDSAFACEGLRMQALHQYFEPENCCTQCPAYFNTKSDLNFHHHIHKLPNTVTCPHCFEVFATAPKLNEHIRVKRKKVRKNCRNDESAQPNAQNCKKARSQSKDSSKDSSISATCATETAKSTENSFHSKENDSSGGADDGGGGGDKNLPISLNAEQKETENIDSNLPAKGTTPPVDKSPTHKNEINCQIQPLSEPAIPATNT